MRRLVQACLLLAAATASTGCFVNQYSADPVRRYNQLFAQSSDLMLIEDDIERFWMLDQPSNLTPFRYYGLAPFNQVRRFKMAPEERGGFESRFLK